MGVLTEGLQWHDELFLPMRPTKVGTPITYKTKALYFEGEVKLIQALLKFFDDKSQKTQQLKIVRFCQKTILQISIISYDS